MGSQRLTKLDLESFAYGERDELEEVVLADPAYLAALEEIWAEELSHDLQGSVMRLVQLERFVSGVLGVTLDLATEIPEVILHYLEVGEDES